MAGTRLDPMVQVITACAASRDRSFLAVCRSAMERCSISIYELGPHATNRPVQTLEVRGSAKKFGKKEICHRTSKTLSASFIPCRLTIDRV